MQCHECNFEPSSLRGWKLHMTKTHGGYTEQQLARIAEDASSEQGAAASGYGSFEEAAAAVAAGAAEPAPDEPKKARRPRTSKSQKEASVALQGEFDSMRGKFSEAIVGILNNVLQQSMDMEPMDSKEVAAMKQAVEFPFRAMNVEFAIQPLNVQLTSFWYTLTIPALMFLSIVLGRAMMPGEKGENDHASKAGTTGTGTGTADGQEQTPRII